MAVKNTPALRAMQAEIENTATPPPEVGERTPKKSKDDVWRAALVQGGGRLTSTALSKSACDALVALSDDSELAGMTQSQVISLAVTRLLGNPPVANRVANLTTRASQAIARIRADWAIGSDEEALELGLLQFERLVVKYGVFNLSLEN